MGQPVCEGLQRRQHLRCLLPTGPPLRCSKPHQAQHFDHLQHHVFQCFSHSKRGRRYHRWQRRHHLLWLRRRIGHRRQRLLGTRELFELVELRGSGLCSRKSGSFGVWTHLRHHRSGRCFLRRLRARVVSKRCLAHAVPISRIIFSSSLFSRLASRRRPLEDAHPSTERNIYNPLLAIQRMGSVLLIAHFGTDGKRWVMVSEGFVFSEMPSC
jgi:hypothetical protein